MDSTRRLALLRNKRGLALVYIALLMVAFCAFLGLAVDIGYMYVAKGQLQNAADSAALAGASGLPNQTDAKDRAKTFAEINPVVPGPDTKVAVSLGDITLGNWNPTRSRTPTDLRFQPDTPPINAVKVEAKRTDGSIGGPIDLFFSGVIDDRWSQMVTSATAIAQKAARAGGYFLVSANVCTNPLPATLSAAANNMAWTSLLSVPTGPGINVNDLICGNVVPDVDVCSNDIYTTNGTTTVFKDMEADFYDPDYDAVNKTYGVDSKGNRVVSTWTIIVPVAQEGLDPTAQPKPIQSWGYAKIRITRACGAGGGNPCSGDRKFFAPPGVCDGSEKDIVIDQITCVDCAHSSDLLGVRPSLVQ